MKILALDTSNQTLAVAVLEDDHVLANFQLNRKLNHSLTLMPAIDQVMAACELAPSDLERIVVAEGPGSYTGIRIAVTTAKTLADTLKIELVGISSLATIAANVLTDKWIVPLFDARRNNVYSGIYRNVNGTLQLVAKDQHQALADLLKQIDQPAIFVGDAQKFSEQITAALPEAEITTTDFLNLPNAAQLGKLGFVAPAATDIQNFVPAYLKKVEAEEQWLKTHHPEDENYVEKI
ncbi:tRNA (adenosine(37)-N6)-threonylcarbamoyltransferase complex dimerization subunit type 1 TsaB [Enterococcus sp. CSURQ0835]|uniref:tRNA (adenosine(37)-N6)-threonylcarbamoyltransferase complex dimerization subunit type 1 TsaB n=1 Tax=Enterococcus sp. CSURQ0835 TaxID=2681394 RepID=UPI00135C4290|nr:tRNA (adenosine(37)-N6)-threonylcarbamoyltransferase complex dimerization subunit type 1 TsaB [Enterococcus sp. CSURQ0835]